MDYTTLVAKSKDTQEQPAKRMQSLYEVCQEVVDGRCARGKRYELAGLLVVLVLAKLAGMQSLQGASDWIADQETLLREGLQLSWKRMPCANTYRDALARLDSQKVNTALAAWCVRKEAESRCGEEPSRLVAHQSRRHEHLAIDGKALRGTGKQAYGGEEPQKQVLHVSEVHTGIVMQQCPLAPEQNEVSTLKPRFSEVLCKGRILTSDAAQSYHEFGRLVKRAGGEVIVFIKNTTPATRADLELFFEDKQADRRTWRSYEHTEKGHGRLERRQIITSPDLNDASRAATGARWGRSFGSNANVQAVTSIASRWSMVGPVCHKSTALPSVWRSSFVRIGRWKIGSTGAVMPP